MHTETLVLAVAIGAGSVILYRAIEASTRRRTGTIAKPRGRSERVPLVVKMPLLDAHVSQPASSSVSVRVTDARSEEALQSLGVVPCAMRAGYHREGYKPPDSGVRAL